MHLDAYGQISRRPSGLRKTKHSTNSLAHRTTWLRSDFTALLTAGMHGLSTATRRAEPCTARSTLLFLPASHQRLRPDLRALPSWNLHSEAAFHSPATTSGSPVRHSEVVVPDLPASHSPKFPRTRSDPIHKKKPVTQPKPLCRVPLSDSVPALSAA